MNWSPLIFVQQKNCCNIRKETSETKKSGDNEDDGEKNILYRRNKKDNISLIRVYFNTPSLKNLRN